MRYGAVTRALLERGLVVASYDLRGHGRSGGERGQILRFDEYVRDADDMAAALGGEPVWRGAGPPVLLGHSLGGLVAFHVALRDPGAVRGLVLSSPFFGLGLDVPAVKKAAGRFLSGVWPSFSMPSGLRGADVTRDAALARAYDNDPLIFKNTASRWFTEALGAQQRALSLAPSMRLPLFIVQAGDDRIASVAATRALFDRVGSLTKTLRIAEGSYHEVFNDLERERWIAEAADAALAFCTPAAP
jgi:alpha-beta hydrolase superfamily lysophospholipase